MLPCRLGSRMASRFALKWRGRRRAWGCGMVSDVRLRLVLFECRFGSEGLRPGYVPFSAPCVASGLAAIERIAKRQAMRQLWGRAHELGGEVVEDEVLWLPTDRFGELWNGLVVILASPSEDVAVAVITTGGLVVAADGGEIGR